MALRAGRVGVNPEAVDIDGFIKGIAADSYTKTEINTMLAGKQDTLTFDATPKSNSNNPVKSKGIYSALAGKQNTLTFDAAPTDASDNPVTSNGVYDAITDVYKDNGMLGAKNMLPYPYFETTLTTNGITFTDNGDGSITASGTASANALFNLKRRINSKAYPNGEYILSGCPSVSGVSMRATRTNGGSGETLAYDYGDGVTVTLNGDDFSNDSVQMGVILFVGNGTNLSTPITFYPMLRLASDTDATYRPYAMSNKDLTDNKQDTLISGTNIKTVNGNSLLGSGNIPISGTGGLTVDTLWTNPNPTTSFSTSIVTLSQDITAYKFLVIDFIEGIRVSPDHAYAVMIPTVGLYSSVTGLYMISSNYKLAKRIFAIESTTTIRFEDANILLSYAGSTLSPTGDQLIPQAVYGIK